MPAGEAERVQLRYGLSRCPLFNDLPPEYLEKILSAARFVRAARKETLFAEGTPSRGFYVILSGQVKVFKTGPEGKAQVLHILGAPASFAEASLFMPHYPATAQALRGTQLAFIDRRLFLRLAEKDIRLLLAIIASLSRWLGLMAERIESLTLRSASGRLAAYVLSLRAEAGPGALGRAGTLRSPLSKTGLAGLLGTTKETISRTLNKLARSKVLLFRGRELRILDAAKLERIAAGG